MLGCGTLQPNRWASFIICQPSSSSRRVGTLLLRPFPCCLLPRSFSSKRPLGIFTVLERRSSEELPAAESERAASEASRVRVVVCVLTLNSFVHFFVHFSPTGLIMTWYLNLPFQAFGLMFHLDSESASKGPNICLASKLYRKRMAPFAHLVLSLGAPKRRSFRHSPSVELLQVKMR